MHTTTSWGLSESPSPVAVVGGVEGAPCSLLEQGFGVEFHVVDAETGRLRRRARGQPDCRWERFAGRFQAVAREGAAEVVVDLPPVALLAVPILGPEGVRQIAAAVFLTRSAAPDEAIRSAAREMGIDPSELVGWSRQQAVWEAGQLARVAAVVVGAQRLSLRLAAVREESRCLTAELASNYEEISLLHRLSQNLRLSLSDTELGRIALEWLAEVVPAEGLAIQFLPAGEPGSSLGEARTVSRMITSGTCPVNGRQFTELIEFLGLGPTSSPAVLNRRATAVDGWPVPAVREMVVVPLAESRHLFGWLAAFNYVGQGEFGSVEASLLGSVGAILGTHSGNVELYRQQAEMLAGIVRALTSAIDAKDPYTCGHSDRVARISVRLGQELGLGSDKLQTIYLAGLLHDIGKIGIDDQVLRKPGKLCDEEYEHIKTHVRIGHNILCDLKKLDDILPGVLYHHESWDGRGYPERRPGESIPQIARIVAVADAFDAMASDRPYRRGMPDEKIDAIFRSGAGKQWDPAVVDAFFVIRDEIRRIMADGNESGPDGFAARATSADGAHGGDRNESSSPAAPAGPATGP